MRNIEHLEAVDLVNWWAIFSRTNGLEEELFFSIPNQGRGGGWQQARRGAYMKAEGLRKGVADYMLAFPVGRYHGMFLELKSEDGDVSKEQRDFLDKTTMRGYYSVACFGLDDAREQIEKYLGGLV